jgi:hypothetical protein
VHSTLRTFCALSAVLAFGGCNCGGPKVNNSQGELTFSPDLQFGVLAVGETGTRSSKLTNVGTAKVNVESLEVTLPFTACVKHLDGTCTGEATVEAGAEATVAVTYAPTAPNASDAENHVSEIIAVNDSVTKPRVSIHAVGHAVAARLVVAPTSLDFGPVEVGDSSELSITLTNKAANPVTITDARLDSTVFTTDLGKLKTKLDAGTSITAKIAYAPQGAQDDSSVLKLSADVAVESELDVPMTGKGLLAKVTLCFGLEGQTPVCLPDAKGSLAGQVDFGALDEGTSQKATLTLKNEGNVQVDLFGLADAKASQAIDLTAAANPCNVQPAATPDFTFTPASFGQKLPEDSTAQVPNPPSEVSIQVVFSPHHTCPPDDKTGAQGDVADRGAVSLKAGTFTNAPSFHVDLLGSSKLGLIKTANVYWDVPAPAPEDYQVLNTGQGPLSVTAVEMVEASADDTDCAQGCTQRKSCAVSALPECSHFGWDTGPQATVIPAAAAGSPTSAVVGRARYTPGVLCGSTPDAGSCFPKGYIRVCTRISSDDPFRPLACGELKGRTF